MCFTLDPPVSHTKQTSFPAFLWPCQVYVSTKNEEKSFKTWKNKIELLNMQMIFLIFFECLESSKFWISQWYIFVIGPSLWNQLIAKVDSFHWGWEWGLKDATIYPQAGFKSDMSDDFGTLLFRSWYGCKLHASWRGHMFNRYSTIRNWCLQHVE